MRRYGTAGIAAIRASDAGSLTVLADKMGCNGNGTHEHRHKDGSVIRWPMPLWPKLAEAKGLIAMGDSFHVFVVALSAGVRCIGCRKSNR